MDLNKMYDEVMELQAELIKDHDDPLFGRPDYQKIKALAVCYELQDYLANEIAKKINAGEMDEYDEEDFNNFEVVEHFECDQEQMKGERNHEQ